MFDDFLKDQRNIIYVTIFMLIAVGTVDALSAEQVTYSVFYLLPLCFIAWFGQNDKQTLIAAFACTLVSFFAEEAMQATQTTWLASYWNASVKLTFFCIVGIGLTRIRRDMFALSSMNKKLKDALHEVKTLKGLLLMCSGCKSIRDDHGYWTKLEDYLSSHTDTKLTHGLCEKCLESEMKELEAFKEEQLEEQEEEVEEVAPRPSIHSPFPVVTKRPVVPPLPIGTEALASFYVEMKDKNQVSEEEQENEETEDSEEEEYINESEYSTSDYDLDDDNDHSSKKYKK
jgi:hypothetical protein